MKWTMMKTVHAYLNAKNQKNDAGPALVKAEPARSSVGKVG